MAKTTAEIVVGGTAYLDRTTSIRIESRNNFNNDIYTADAKAILEVLRSTVPGGTHNRLFRLMLNNEIEDYNRDKPGLIEALNTVIQYLDNEITNPKI